MDNDKAEKLGQIIDRIDNLTYSLSMNLPEKMHIECMRESLPKIVKDLKDSFVEITGENPWD